MKKLLLALCLLLPGIIYADTPSQVDFLIGGLTDSSGDPLNLGKVYTYACGTTTDKTTWQDAGKVSTHTNPIILDSQGKKLVFADGCYKFQINSSADVPLYTLDNLRFGSNGASSGYAGPTTGSANAYVATLSPALLALTNGFEIIFEANHTNTGAATLNVNGLGAIDLNRSDDRAFSSGEIIAGTTYLAVYEASTNAWLVIRERPEFANYLNQTTGSANTYVATSEVPIPKLRNGTKVVFEINATNTGASTLNVDGLGAIDIVTASDTALVAGQLVINYTYSAIYESGTNAWILQTPTSDANTYTPTFTNVTNVAASTPAACGYKRLWNLVDVWCIFDVDPTAAAPTVSELGISLPIASNLIGNDAWGVCAPTVSTTERSGGVVPDTANDRAKFQWATADLANHTMACSFSYVVH